MNGTMQIRIVATGTPVQLAGGILATIDDTFAAVDQSTGIALMTQRNYDLLKELLAPPPIGGAE